jgi:rfaE bifunctional protein kinase chain/domain/rfaE bifunctional protein nucleotidyltransferase chain/domain
MKNKIILKEDLKKKLDFFKSKGKKIVHCHGTFDLLHLGHIKHLSNAKKIGDILVVTITADKFVNKGPGRPYFKSKERAEAIASLQLVDYVVINNDFTPKKIIQFLRPNIYCKGPDYINQANDVTQEIKNDIKAIKSVGGKIVYTKDETFSSSSLINQFSDLYSGKTLEMFKRIKKNYNFKNIRQLIEKFKELKILVIGEIIIDEYIFCESLGKSGKEPVLTFKNLYSERSLGGSAAISRHLASFCKQVTLLSMIGEKNENLNEIKRGLPKNVKLEVLKKKNSPTIIKKRYIDKISLSKMLGVYSINDDLISKIQEKELLFKIKNIINKYDMIVVADYGHGFITSQAAKLITKTKKFVALNAQINSANIGYKTMENYKNLDFVVINQREIQHELRDRHSKVEELMIKLSKKLNIKNLVVTRGLDGAILYNLNSKKFSYSDAFAKNTIDKVGAGDAMLSIVSMFLKTKSSGDLALLAGSLASSQSTQTMANKKVVNKIDLLKSLEHILK